MIDRATYPWLIAIRKDPQPAVEELLRGYAYLPSLERATPSEALRVIMGDLEETAEEWGILDSALLEVLQDRENANEEAMARPGGIGQFIYETSEGFRSAWILRRLSKTVAWLRSDPLHHWNWADDFEVEPGYDIAASILTALAQTQEGENLNLMWHRVCREAADSKKYHRLDIGLLGLAKMKIAGKKQDDHTKIILGGFATWASQLPDNAPRYKVKVEQKWRSLKASFSHPPSFWQTQFDLLNEAKEPPPYIAWLKNADNDLSMPSPAVASRASYLPENTHTIVNDFKTKFRKQGLTDENLHPIKTLISQQENYADYTGDSLPLGMTSNMIAKFLAGSAPYYSLYLIQKAQQRDLNNGFLWSNRAKILDNLNQKSLAKAVLWEGWRRAPTHGALPLSLALIMAREANYKLALKLLERCKEICFATKDSKGLFFCLTYSSQINGIMGDREKALKALDEALKIDQNNITDMIRADLANGERGRDNLLKRLTNLTADQTTKKIDWDDKWKEIANSKEKASKNALENQRELLEIEFATSHLTKWQNSEIENKESYLANINKAIETKKSRNLAYFLKARLDSDLSNYTVYNYTGFKSNLPLQLVVPSPDYDSLIKNYYEKSYLIHLVRYEQNQDMDSCEFLGNWSKKSQANDTEWIGHLKIQTQLNLDNQGAELPDNVLPLSKLKNSALLQAIDCDFEVMRLIA